MTSKETDLQVAKNAADATVEDKQRRRMLVALALLVVALIVVLIRDRQFLSSSSQPSEPVAAEQPAPTPTAVLTPTVAPAINTQTTPVPTVQQAPSAPPPEKAKSRKVKEKKAETQPPPAEVSQPSAGPVITATNRTVLPPLEMEVVAGNQHRPLSPSNNSVKVDMGSGTSAAPMANATPSTDAASPSAVPDTSAQVTVPPTTAERVTHSVRPEYPLLAKQMKVQGAVVLQALIDKAGRIQELHVVTGPTILASAAQEAVKQWRFKPYFQQGQAVETEARITVNFTISTY